MASRTWLRTSYRVGAVVDGLAALAMLSQAFFGTTSPLREGVPEPPYRYAMGMAGSLMLGWTLLLLWADRDPVARRGVLPLTIVVILGLMGTGLLAMSIGFLPASSVVPVLLLQAALIGLFATSFVKSSRSDQGAGSSGT